MSILANITLNGKKLTAFSVAESDLLLDVATTIFENVPVNGEIGGTNILLHFRTHKPSMGGSIIAGSNSKLDESVSVLMPSDSWSGQYDDLTIGDLDTIFQHRLYNSTGGHGKTKYSMQRQIEIELEPIYGGLVNLINENLYPLN